MQFQYGFGPNFASVGTARALSRITSRFSALFSWPPLPGDARFSRLPLHERSQVGQSEGMMGIVVQWKPEYSIGDREIDRQHRTLFDLANQVFSVDDVVQIKAAVLTLYRYMEQHFAQEEELMARVEYEGLAQHKVQHQQIIAEMNGLLTLCSDFREFHGKLRHLMVDWVLGHVVDADTQIAESVARARSLHA
jgi:hemerythrin